MSVFNPISGKIFWKANEEELMITSLKFTHTIMTVTT